MNLKSLASLLGVMLVSGLHAQSSPFQENFGDLANGATLTTNNSNLNYIRQAAAGGSSIVGNVSGGVHRARITTASMNQANLPAQFTGFGRTGITASPVFDLSLDVVSSYWRVNSGLIIALGNWDNSTDLYTDQVLGSQGTMAMRLSGNSGHQSAKLDNLSSNGSDYTWSTLTENAVSVNDVSKLRFVGNTGSEAITINSVQILTGEVAVWIDDTFIDKVVLLDTTAPVSLRILAYGRGGSNSGSLIVDIGNIQLLNQIPEPATFALLAALVSIGVIMITKRRK